MAPIHDRMPVILSRNDYAVWLDPAATEPGKLLTPCPADELICYPVNSVVNNARNQGAQCMSRFNEIPQAANRVVGYVGRGGRVAVRVVGAELQSERFLSASRIK